MFEFLIIYSQLATPYLSYVFFATGCCIALFFLGILILNPYQKQVEETKRATKSILRAKRKCRPIYATLPETYQKVWQTLDLDAIKQTDERKLSQKLVFNEKRSFWIFDLLLLPFCLALLPVSASKFVLKEFDALFFVPLVLFFAYLIAIQTRRLTYIVRKKRATIVHDKYVALLDLLLKEGFKPVSPTTRNKNSNRVQFVKIFDCAPIITTRTLFDTTQNPPVTQNAISNTTTIDFLTQNGIEPLMAEEIDQLQQNSSNLSIEEETRLNALLDDAFKQTCKAIDD